MNEFGITILRFSDDEVLNQMENVLRAIEFYIFEYEKHTPSPSQGGIRTAILLVFFIVTENSLSKLLSIYFK